MKQSFIQQIILSIYCVPGTVVGAEDAAVNGEDKVPVLNELIS